MGILKSISRTVMPDCEWRGSEHNWIKREKRREIYKTCMTCGKMRVYRKSDVCDHEWGDPEIDTIFNPTIGRNEYGYYVFETDVEDKECTKCGYVDTEEIEKRKVYFKVRERVPQ